MVDIRGLPGGDLVADGVADLQAGKESIVALLVSVGEPRLKALGLDLPPSWDHPEHGPYSRLSDEDSRSAHSRYNALIRRLVSLERAMACAR